MILSIDDLTGQLILNYASYNASESSVVNDGVILLSSGRSGFVPDGLFALDQVTGAKLCEFNEA
jgi:hypothetical protein